MPINENEIIPENEEQADELLNQIESPNPAEEQPNQETPAPAIPEDYAFTVGGKEVKGKWSTDREKLIKWAQMGYEAPTRIGSLTKEIESWKQKETAFKEMESKYGEIDKFVREKPEFWEHVTKAWNERDKLFNDPSNPLASTVQSLQQQMQDLINYKNQVEQERQQTRMAREDGDYQKEFGELKTKYPQIDFVTPDEQGKSLEYKVLEYAQANGIRKFTTAFRDFYHDELVKHHSEQAKENLVKEKQKNTKLGILGITNTPTKRSSDDVRGKSYNDLANEIVAEFNLS